MPLADKCGRIVNGHPCMRVPGHTGIHIPGTPDDASVTYFNNWDIPDYDDSIIHQVKRTAMFVAIPLILLIGFQVYLDTLVMLHWGWLCLLSGSRYAVSNARVISPAS